MSYLKKIEFKSKEIKKFHFLIRHIEPLSSELYNYDSDIWAYLLNRYPGIQPDQNFPFEKHYIEKHEIFHYRCGHTYDKVVYTKDKIFAHFGWIELDHTEYTQVSYNNPVFVYDLLTGEIMFKFGEGDIDYSKPPYFER